MFEVIDTATGNKMSNTFTEQTLFTLEDATFFADSLNQWIGSERFTVKKG